MDTKYTNDEALQKLMSELDIGLNCEEIYSEEDTKYSKLRMNLICKKITVSIDRKKITVIMKLR